MVNSRGTQVLKCNKQTRPVRQERGVSHALLSSAANLPLASLARLCSTRDQLSLVSPLQLLGLRHIAHLYWVVEAAVSSVERKLQHSIGQNMRNNNM
jgi:hypothetical protein